MTIKFPGLIPLLRAFLIEFILLPWIYFLFYWLKIFDSLEAWMNIIFSYVSNKEDMTEKGKKSNGFLWWVKFELEDNAKTKSINYYIQKIINNISLLIKI